LTDRLEQIAKQLMESYIHSRNRANFLHQRGAFKEKPGEIMVLYCIGKHVKDGLPGLMVSEISGKLNVTSPTVTQHIKSLEAQGLVERHVDPADRRVVRVRLTEKGEKLIQRVKEARLKMYVGLVKYLGEEESLRFAETMRKASDYLQKQTEDYMRHFFVEGDEGN